MRLRASRSVANVGCKTSSNQHVPSLLHLQARCASTTSPATHAATLRAESTEGLWARSPPEVQATAAPEESTASSPTLPTVPRPALRLASSAVSRVPLDNCAAVGDIVVFHAQRRTRPPASQVFLLQVVCLRLLSLDAFWCSWRLAPRAAANWHPSRVLLPPLGPYLVVLISSPHAQSL